MSSRSCRTRGTTRTGSSTVNAVKFVKKIPRFDEMLSPIHQQISGLTYTSVNTSAS